MEGNEEMKAVAPIADVSICNDDDNAIATNEDLSLKIIEKATQVANPNDVDLHSDILTNLSDERSNDLKEEKQNSEKTEKGKDAKEDHKPKAEKEGEVVVKVEETTTNAVATSGNIVLRRLLRGPRYFDPPDSGWGACYNCGEEGHAAVNCTAPRRKKPCFICGSLQHNAKQCSKGHDCFICKKGGHRAKDCPEKNKGASQNPRICLKCGDSGHDMFSCRNNYHPDDLKEIKCYVCREFGHLCCVEDNGSGPKEVSCYRCGLIGHTGLACSASYGETSGARSASSCYRCGEDGHFARECTSTTKVGKKFKKRNGEPKKRWRKEYRDGESRSAPHDLVQVRNKKKKALYEGEHASGSKSKRRGGWSTEDPVDLRGSKRKASNWKSPATPSNKRARDSNYTPPSNSSSSRKPRKIKYSNSASPKYNRSRLSASRFGNNNSDVVSRNFHWSYD